MSNRKQSGQTNSPTPDQPGWTVARPVVSCFEFHRQLPGSESVGGVTLLIEPRQDSRSIVFVVGLPDDLKAEWGWASEIVRDTVNEVIEKGLDGQKPVVGLTVTLMDLYTHLIDSRPHAFRKATERALLGGFKAVGLVEWRSALAAE
ncbi:MAG: hypothetical protein ACJ8F7_11840 [Gemmataceae bacterium]